MHTVFTRKTPWLTHSKNAHKPLLRLFCFPYAGGGASIYRSWAKSLKIPVEITAVQLPGRENRMAETPRSSVSQLAQEVCDAIESFFELPFVFFGHSMGALLAFTVCRELRRRRLALPERLIVSASRPPHIPEPTPLHHLDDEKFIDELRRFSGTPEAVLANEEIMRLFLPVLRADFALEETYAHTPEPPLPIPVTAICGNADPEVSLEEMKLWSRHASGDFGLKTVEGGHFFINEQHSQLLQLIGAILSSHPAGSASHAEPAELKAGLL